MRPRQLDLLEPSAEKNCSRQHSHRVRSASQSVASRSPCEHSRRTYSRPARDQAHRRLAAHVRGADGTGRARLPDAVVARRSCSAGRSLVPMGREARDSGVSHGAPPCASRSGGRLALAQRRHRPIEAPSFTVVALNVRNYVAGHTKVVQGIESLIGCRPSLGEPCRCCRQGRAAGPPRASHIHLGSATARQRSLRAFRFWTRPRSTPPAELPTLRRPNRLGAGAPSSSASCDVRSVTSVAHR